MANILFISHDVVGAQMAGTGIRAAELCRVLAREHALTLATPRPADALPPGVAGYAYRIGDAASLAPALAAAEVIIANGFLLGPHPELADAPAPLVLDMYDPVPLENIALFRRAEAARRADQARDDALLLARQLRAADCLLCATERQRDLYLGALLASGRLAPQVLDGDPALRGLLRVVPFGLPETPPAPAPPPWGALPPDALVMLWSGGLWDWLDPLTLIRALPQIVAAVPQAHLVFLAGQHPGDVHPMQMPGHARALAQELGLLGGAVTFVDHWVPYAERAGALLAASVAVYLHEESLESSYAAVRSRFLDHLWCGLPSVVSAGDAAAALVAAHGLGRVVPPGDAAATAAALVALLRDADERRACAERARGLAATCTWAQVAAPLLAFCRSPQRAPDRRPNVSLPITHNQLPMTNDQFSNDQLPMTNDQFPIANDQLPITNNKLPMTNDQLPEERDRRARELDATRNAVLRDVASGWQAREPSLPGGLVGRIRNLFVAHIVRPFVAPLFAQQNAQNAAVIRALDALAESSDARRSEAYTLLDQLEQRMGVQQQQIRAEQQQFGVEQQRVHDELRAQLHEVRLQIHAESEKIRRRVDRINDRLTNAEQHVGSAEADIGRIDALLDHTRITVKDWLIDLEEADTLLAERLAAGKQPEGA